MAGGGGWANIVPIYVVTVIVFVALERTLIALTPSYVRKVWLLLRILPCVRMVINCRFFIMTNCVYWETIELEGRMLTT